MGSLGSQYVLLPLLVLHENQLTHTDLKPENILFVNSEFETLYNEHKVDSTDWVGKSVALL